MMMLGDQRIQHVVVVYQENRAFDHLFGWDKRLNVNGLNGNESNPIDPRHPEEGSVRVYDGAHYVDNDQWDLQPTHEYFAYSKKFDIVNSTPTMNGFVHVERQKHRFVYRADQVMQGFSQGALPVTSMLAAEFAVFDQWYAAFPGPSWPNHMFSMSGTAAGGTETGAYFRCENSTKMSYPQRTIFDALLENGHEYARIYNDSATDLYMASLNSTEARARTQRMDRFFADAARGTLPALTWIAPRQGVNESLGIYGGPNSDHPDCCDVALGERLRKDVYEAVRAGPGWNATALLFTWDDPGGWFDHVPPPMRAPAPDEQPACYCGGGSPGAVADVGAAAPNETCLGPPPNAPPDPYTRLGSRLPVVLVSPWVRKGTVVGAPTGPEPDSQYDGTSIIATLKHLFRLPSFLTRRDAWAGTFEHLFEELEAPRVDAPLHLPPAPKPSPSRGPHPWGGDCDDPTRRMRRSIAEFERLMPSLQVPPRLRACAHAAPLWATRCETGTMLEASAWLGNVTEQWRRSV